MNVNQCMESLVVSSKPLAVREYRLYFKRLNLGVYLNRLHVSLKKMNLRLTRSCLDGGYRSSWRPLLGFWMLRVSTSLSLNWPTVAFPKTTSFRLLALVSKFLTFEAFSGLCYSVLQAQATTLEWTQCTCSCIIQLLGQCLHPYA